MTLRIVFGALLAVAAFELADRAIEASPFWRVVPLVEVSAYETDPYTGYALRPNVIGVWETEQRNIVTTNAFGLRSPVIALDKPAGVARVGVFGDSIVEALQVELGDTFSALAERRLNESCPGRVEVLNFGMSGATPAVQLERFRHKSAAFGLDRAVFFLNIASFESRTMADDSSYPAYPSKGEGHVSLGHGFRDTWGYRLRTGPIGQALYVILRYSRFASLINYRLNRGFFTHDAGTPDLRASDDASQCEAGLSEAVRHLDLWANGRPSEMDIRLTAFLDDLSRELIRQHVSGVAFVTGLGMPTQGCPAENRMLLSQAVEARLASVGLGFVDLDRAIAARAGSAHAVALLHGFGRRIGAGHLNEAGHRLYADIVADNLTCVVTENFSRAKE